MGGEGWGEAVYGVEAGRRPGGETGRRGAEAPPRRPFPSSGAGPRRGIFRGGGEGAGFMSLNIPPPPGGPGENPGGGFGGCVPSFSFARPWRRGGRPAEKEKKKRKGSDSET